MEYRSLAFLGFPSYRIGRDSTVWSSKPKNGKGNPVQPWRELKQIKTSHGYFSVHLRAGAASRSYYVHQLILLAFVGPCPEGMEACHFPDPDRANNSLENLRWASHSQNMMDRVAHGTDNGGIRHGLSKLSAEDIREIRRDHAAGLTMYRIAMNRRLGQNVVRNIIRGKSYKNVL